MDGVAKDDTWAGARREKSPASVFAIEEESVGGEALKHPRPRI